MNPRTARKLLTEERERLEGLLEGLGQETEGDWSGAEVSLTDQHPADVGTERFERDKDISILNGIEGELTDVKHALHRLDEGGYGTCEACGRPISADRLRARPGARFCIEDQALAERELRSA